MSTVLPNKFLFSLLIAFYIANQMVYLVLYTIGGILKQQTRHGSFNVNPCLNVCFKIIKKKLEFKRLLKT